MLRAVSKSKSISTDSRSIAGIRTLDKAPVALPSTIDSPILKRTASSLEIESLLNPESFHESLIASWIHLPGDCSEVSQPRMFSKLLRSARNKLSDLNSDELKTMKKASRLLDKYEHDREYVYKMLAAVISA